MQLSCMMRIVQLEGTLLETGDGLQMPSQHWCIAIIDQPEEKHIRPNEADQFIVSSTSNRSWDKLSGRMFAPIKTLWILGFTAMILRSIYLSENLAPNAYDCFLFRQMVGQWHYAATRSGTMWTGGITERFIGFHQNLVLLNGMNTFMLLALLSCSRSSWLPSSR